MIDEKALQVVPSCDDYVVQAHVISRAAYAMPVMQRRLIHLAMAQAQIKGQSIELVEMAVGDIVRALGLSDNRYDEIRAASRGLMSQVLDVDGPDGWVQYHWVEVARYIKSRDVIQFRVAFELLPMLLQVKAMFRYVPTKEIAKLQGKHSYRIFEMVMANNGFAGKGGNRPGEWFVDFDFGDLRTLLKIKPTEYKDTSNFRRKVIDNPVREVNDAGLGLRIECDYDRFRRGRVLYGVRLNCKLLKAEDPRPVSPATKAEHEENVLVAAYPEIYAKFLEEQKSSPPLGADMLMSAENRALRDLAEWAKTQKAEAKPRRNRPPKQRPS